MASLLTRRMATVSLSRPVPTTRIQTTSRVVVQNSRVSISDSAGRSLSTLANGRPLMYPSSSISSSSSSSTLGTTSTGTTFLSPTRSFSRRSAPAVATKDGDEEPKRQRHPQISSDHIPPAFLRKLPRKPAPSIVRKRIAKLRTYVGTEKDIRHSPWRLNLICQFAAGQTVPEALTQLEYVRKSRAPLVRKAINSTVKAAVEKDGVHPTQLEVAECFATHGKHIKRMKIMGRGRTGIMHHRFSHIRVVLREIDFPLKIALCNTVRGKKKWLEKMKEAEVKGEAARAEREELERLEKELEERKQAKEEAEKK